MELDAYVWNTVNRWILCRSKQCLVCVSLMASHLIAGHTNYYITVTTICKPGYKWFVTQALAFDLPTHNDASMSDS